MSKIDSFLALIPYIRANYMKMEHQITFGERMLNTLLTITVVVLIGILVSVVIAVGLEAVGFF